MHEKLFVAVGLVALTVGLIDNSARVRGRTIVGGGIGTTLLFAGLGGYLQKSLAQQHTDAVEIMSLILQKPVTSELARS